MQIGDEVPDFTTPSDLSVGAFSDDGPWVVVPGEMAWRRGIDELRERAAAQVPEMIRPRRLPPLRGAAVALKLSAAMGPWLVRNRRRKDDPAAQAELAAKLRPAFESLGTTFIKLGQLIASAEGMLPAALVTEFKLCRDRVPAESIAHVRTVIEEDLGRTLAELFAEFDPVPIAAASVAQVHVARLHSGEEVVVKVQRPGIDRIVPRDIATLAWLAPIIEKRSPQAAMANLPAYIELFAETIVEELDFRLEAQNMLDIAAVLAATDQHAVIVPRPHPQLVSRRVLVMERMHGYGVDDEAAMSAAGVDPSPVYRALMVSFLEGAMIHGAFHGDLHGGNMMVTEGGRPAILDFGITGRFAPGKRQALLGLMMTAASQDARAMLGYFRDLGGFPPDADMERLADELGIEELMAQNPNDVSPEVMAVQMRETTKRLVAHGAKLPKEMFLFMKGLVYLGGALTSIAPDVDMFGEMAQIYSLFTTGHVGHLEAAGLDVDAMPDGGQVAELMRQQVGTDAGSMTYLQMQQLQSERAAELRAAMKRMG
ncbi:MAG: AarF/UbiB family protein [Actinomycetota bacterium]|nr:AarF/UbiB family protein [Actinomycetota bacterium]